MKHAFGILLIGCAIGLSGCASSSLPSPKEVAQQYANDIETTNFQRASGLYVNSNSSDLKQFEQKQNTPQMAAVDDLFKHTKIIIGNEHITGNSATVDATVTSPNLGQVLAKVTQNALANSFSGNVQSSNEIANALDNAISDPSVQSQTTKTEIILTKTKDGWRISNTNNGIASAITGGLSNLFSASPTNKQTLGGNKVTSPQPNSNVPSPGKAPITTNTTPAAASPSPSQAAAPTLTYIGEKVQVGPFLMEAPLTTNTPVLRTSNNNVFAFGTSPMYLFIEMDVTNASDQPQTLSDGMFQFTWTPTGGDTQYYVGDISEEYSVNAATYYNGQYYFGSPLPHEIAPHTTEKLDLVYDIPPSMSPNEAGTIGLSAKINNSVRQLFALSKFN